MTVASVGILAKKSIKSLGDKDNDFFFFVYSQTCPQPSNKITDKIDC